MRGQSFSVAHLTLVESFREGRLENFLTSITANFVVKLEFHEWQLKLVIPRLS